MSCCKDTSTTDHSDPKREPGCDPLLLVEKLEQEASKHEFYVAITRHQDAVFHEIVAACCRKTADAIRRMESIFPGGSDGEAR